MISAGIPHRDGKFGTFPALRVPGRINPDFIPDLVDAAAAPYRSAGRFAWHFARGKLAGDPLFLGLLDGDLVPDNADLLDLGCGQGLLASWLFSAAERFAAGNWPDSRPKPPKLASYRGVELMPRDVNRARQAIGTRADIVTGDVRGVELTPSDAVVIVDVLHYLPFVDQDDLLQRVHAALRPGGVLLLRVGDAAGGVRFRYSTWVDHVVTFWRGHRLARFYCRSMQAWQGRLAELGFAVESIPMTSGPPFANVLLVGRKAEIA